MSEWIYVAMGGAGGSLLRYAVTLYALSIADNWPLGTAVVNGLGSFLIGLSLPFLARLPVFVHPLLIVGFLGGFTTMSSYAGDVVKLIAEQRYGTAAGVWALGAILCVALCGLGYAVAARA